MSKNKSAEKKQKQLEFERWQRAQQKSTKYKNAKNRSYFRTPTHAKAAGWVYIANAVLLVLIIIFMTTKTHGSVAVTTFFLPYIVLSALFVWQLISGLKLIKRANDFLKGKQ